MAVKEVTKMGNPILRKEANLINPKDIQSQETKQLLTDMYDTMMATGGIGIAAPQIGVSISAAIIKIPTDSERYPSSTESELYTIFNPKIEPLGNETQGFWEGCLSVPGLRGYVTRPKRVKISFLNEEAQEMTLELDGFLSTVFQHELDHLFGKLYIDRITDLSKLSYEEEYEQYWLDDYNG